ncbi:MAG TPA: hypothetical protein VMV25_13125 [Steroidobacteraceae bacterium]|nr:hypothetical protein [Steroidobacteraceae bacterium]
MRSPQPRTARELLLALTLKALLLAAIYLLFFGPDQRPRSDAAATASALIGRAGPGYSR